jgi:hypothetical protein
MIIVIGFAVLCFIIPSFVWAFFLLMSRLRSSVATGTIIGHDAGSADGDVSAPIVEYQLPDGRKITFTDKVYSNQTILDLLYELFLKYILKRDTDQVKVLYDPNNPQKARVNSFGNIYFMPIILFLIGLFISLYAIPGVHDILDSILNFIERLTKNL